jgi:hypothetical protein
MNCVLGRKLKAFDRLWILPQGFKSRSDALTAVQKSINAYNNLRQHMSCDYLTQTTHIQLKSISQALEE